MKKFKKLNLQWKKWIHGTQVGFGPMLHYMTTFFDPISFEQNRAVVEDCSRNLRFEGSNPTKTSSFHLENWFFENFHRGPYFVGFQTKWIMTPKGTYFNALIVFLISFWCSFDFCSTYCEIVLQIYFLPCPILILTHFSYISCFWSYHLIFFAGHCQIWHL